LSGDDDGIELTGILAQTALDAFFLVNPVWLLAFSVDGILGADFFTDATADAFILIDGKTYE
jgi:hypothetical protein